VIGLEFEGGKVETEEEREGETEEGIPILRELSTKKGRTANIPAAPEPEPNSGNEPIVVEGVVVDVGVGVVVKKVGKGGVDVEERA
jgi:hypothetical protein